MLCQKRRGVENRDNPDRSGMVTDRTKTKQTEKDIVLPDIDRPDINRSDRDRPDIDSPDIDRLDRDRPDIDIDRQTDRILDYLWDSVARQNRDGPVTRRRQ